MKNILLQFFCFILLLFVTDVAEAGVLIQVDTLISRQRLEALVKTEENFLNASNKLMDMEKKMKELKSSLETRKKDNEKLQRELEKVQEKASKSKLTQRVEVLEKQLKEAREELEARAHQDKENEQSLQQLKEDFAQQIQDSSQVIQQLKNELAGLADIREQWFRQLVAEADAKWLTKPYSEIRVDDLQTSMAPYQQYAGANQDIQKTYEELQQLLTETRLYRKGEDALSKPFDLEAVESLLEELKLTQRSLQQSFRKQDVDNLVSLFEDYGLNIRTVQRLIARIETKYKGVPGSEFLVEDLIKAENDDLGTVDMLESYPWLKEQFEAYRQYMKKNGVEENEYGQTIMNLKTE